MVFLMLKSSDWNEKEGNELPFICEVNFSLNVHYSESY